MTKRSKQRRDRLLRILRRRGYRCWQSYRPDWYIVCSPGSDGHILGDRYQDIDDLAKLVNPDLPEPSGVTP